MGVNFFDIAISYQSGTSKQYVGQALLDFARREENIIMTPYNALAGGRLSKRPAKTSKRYAQLKYGAAQDQDAPILARVAELADHWGVSMPEISLTWLLTKVTVPVIRATKLHHIEGAAKAVDLVLTAEERAYLEELYTPHPLVGVMVQNTAAAAFALYHFFVHPLSDGQIGGSRILGYRPGMSDIVEIHTSTCRPLQSEGSISMAAICSRVMPFRFP